MALSLEDSNLVWQKVKIALADSNPAIQNQFAELKKYFAQQLRNPQLQFVPFTEVQADDADGTGIVDAACKVYAFYAKKNSSGTDAYVKLYDSATVDTTAGEQLFAFPMLIASEQIAYFHVGGQAMANGVTITQHTTSIGTTDASEGADGFVIIGAP